MLKKLLNAFLLTVMFGITLGLSACSFSSCQRFIDAPLRKHMIKYYSDDSNYINLNGVIISMYYSEWEIDITTENSNFTGEGYVKFHVMNGWHLVDEMEIGDEISFVTAPMDFYNGHIIPIVALEKDGQTYLSFEDGKEDYLQWIENTFG